MHQTEKSLIQPNYLTEESRLAEERMVELLELAKDLGVELFTLTQGKEAVLEMVREDLPKRYDLVIQKLDNEGLSLDDLSDELVLDRMLGIDAVFIFDGVVYAVDVTTAKHTAILNKKKKIQQMQHIYEQLGIQKALILQLQQRVTEDLVLDVFGQLENKQQTSDAFSFVLKYKDLSKTE